MNNNYLANAVATLLASQPNVTPSDLIAMRVKIGLTQEKLAARLHVTTRTIQHWEAGTRTPPMSAVIVLTLLSTRTAAATPTTAATPAAADPPPTPDE